MEQCGGELILKNSHDKQKIKKITEMFGKISLYAFLCAFVSGITVGFVNNDSLKSISSGFCYFCICASVFCLTMFFILDSILDSTIDEETKKRMANSDSNDVFKEDGYFGKFK